jgi:hypothetical protein
MDQAEQSDHTEDEEHQDKTGFEIPKELKIKEKRLAKIREAKGALVFGQPPGDDQVFPVEGSFSFPPVSANKR